MEKGKEQIIIENQVAIFNLLGALFREITNKAPKVIVNSESGIIVLEPSPHAIIYQEEASQILAEPAKEIGRERQRAPAF